MLRLVSRSVSRTRRFCTKPKLHSINSMNSPLMVLNVPIGLSLIPTTYCCIKDPSLIELLTSATISAELAAIWMI